MNPLVISLVAGVAVAVFALFVWLWYRDYSGSKSLEDRLGRVTGQKTPTLEAAGILKEPMYPEELKGVAQRLLPQLPNMTRLFEQADFKMAPAKFWALTGVLVLVGAALPTFANLPYWMMFFTGTLLGFAPIAYVNFLRKRRLTKFGAQLCEALELIARALRAGHSLAAGMHVVSDEMPDPVSTEFGRVWEEQNLGISIEDAMRNLADRVPNLDLKFFVTAVIIQRQTGGDLSEVLDKIGYVIRERFKIQGMVQALTGEGRISGVVLIALPFGLLLMMMNLSPEYISALWNDTRGVYMSLGGLFSMLLGSLWIRKIVNIKI